MTREQAKELLPIIQAYTEGKQIQVFNNFCDNKWTDCIPLFNLEPERYRIKPEPREFWLVPSQHSECDRGSKDFQGFHVYTCKQYTPLEQIHVKEIID